MRRLIVLLILITTILALTAQTPEPVVIAVQDVVLQVSETSSVPIQIECPAMNCSTIDLTLNYDPSVIKITSFNWGDFPISQDSEILSIQTPLNAISGTFRISYVTTNGISASDSSGVLMNLDIRALSSGITAISPSGIVVGEIDGSAIQSIVTQVGELTIQEIEPTLTPTTMPCQADPGDIDNNGVIDGNDLRQVSNAYMQSTSNNVLSDLNNDGKINVLDAILVSRNLGQVDECAS